MDNVSAVLGLEPWNRERGEEWRRGWKTGWACEEQYQEQIQRHQALVMGQS